MVGRNKKSEKVKALIAQCKKSPPKYVTSVLNKSTQRLRVSSPVSAPLVFRRSLDVEPTVNEDGTIQENTQQRERAQAKALRRRHEDELWQRYLNGRSDAARNTLWIHYQPLVRYLSERLKTKLPECIDVFDLIGAGNLGLQDAITKFEPDVGVRFETYCVPRIRGAILDSIRALDWVPRLIRNKGHQFERLIRELAADLHREPRDDEIAARLRMSSEEFIELKKELDVKTQLSVEGCAKDNADERDRTRLEMLENQDEIEPTRDLQREEIRTIALKNLNDKERTVVEQYYFQGRSMKQIGTELGLSESRICQIHSQVMVLLRKKFRAYQDSCNL